MEELNPGPPTVPRQAASVILLGGGAEALEVLLVRRNPRARFMPGVWVFPGGAVDTGEGEGDEAHRAAAVRELAEEAGIHGVDPAALMPYSRWITPAEIKTRFDTHFFLVPVPAAAAPPRADGAETVDIGWFTPQRALAELELVFPTIKHLEQLAGFPTAAALLEHAQGREVVPIQPKVRLEGETARIVLPGDPAY